MLELLGLVRRYVSVVVGGLRVRPEAEKHLHRLGVAVARRDVQRRRAAGPELSKAAGSKAVESTTLEAASSSNEAMARHPVPLTPSLVVQNRP